ERVHRALWNIGDLFPENVPLFCGRKLCQLLALEFDFTGFDATVVREQAEDRFGSGRFPGAGLASETVVDAFFDAERDAVDGVDGVVSRTVRDREVRNVEMCHVLEWVIELDVYLTYVLT